MEFDNINNFTDSNLDDAISLREVVERYLKQWKWYFLSVLLFLTATYFFLQKKTPVYEAYATILIKELDKGSSVADLSSFEDLGLVSSSDNSIENEIHILTSRRLMKKVVKELRLNTRFYIESSPYDIEVFPNFPLFISMNEKEFVSDSIDINNNFVSPIDKINAYFQILVLSETKYEFINHKDETFGIRKFDQFISTDFGRIKISLNQETKANIIGKKIKVYINPIEFVAASYIRRIVVEPIDERSRVIKISIRENVVEKGLAIVNNLIEQYNQDAVDDKNKIHINTIKFLDERIDLLTNEMMVVERTAEQFQTRNRMVNADAGVQSFLNSSSANENELISASTQLEVVNYMIEELKNKGLNETLPVNVGLSDPSITNISASYNELILRKNRILKSSSAQNPIIISFDSQLKGMKNNLLKSLYNLKNSTEIRIRSLSEQSSKINYRIASVPKNERELKDIVRQQETKNVLYQFLLQKREESVLSKSVNVDKAKIVDSAFSNWSPVSPKKNVNYMIAIFMGLLIPTVVIYLRDLLDTKVHDEKDLTRLKLPIIGEIPESKVKKQKFTNDNEPTELAEAFRFVRTNIGFMLDKKSYGKIIFVTSTIKGEGKTFTSINLSKSLAITGKKTILLGMDLRAPKISKYLGLEDKPGVTNFIKNNDLEVDDIIERNTQIINLDLINSGDIPPNPVELLMSKRVDEIFEYCTSNYEFIIVDTAPVGMVTDTIQISKYADLTIYVIKSNYLDKRMLHIPVKLSKENKLKNMALLLNETDINKGGYGYGYGYGATEKKKWYKKIFA